jgi:glycosyltransferase involved in cell wall biosynthesis
MPWLGRLARLASRWRVLITGNVFGTEYRQLMRRARIVFNHSIRGECNLRTFEAAAAGALLLQEAGNVEVPAYFSDRQECIYYGDAPGELEGLIEHYLTHEAERRAIGEAARARVHEFTFYRFWQEQVGLLAEELPALTLRAKERAAQMPTFELPARLWQSVSAGAGSDAALQADLAAALMKGKDTAFLHCAMGLELAQQARRTGQRASLQNLLQHFHGAATEGDNPVASLNFAEALLLAGRNDEAKAEASKALRRLERTPRLPAVALETPHFPVGYDTFRVEWERAAWQNAGRADREAEAKRDLLRWRLHGLLGFLTSDPAHDFEATLLRPDLPATRAALGCALARSGRLDQAAAHLEAAVAGNPFDGEAARALHRVWGELGDTVRQRRVARDHALLQQAAPRYVGAEPWFDKAPPVGDELASIIILCCNQLDYSRECLETLLQHTRQSYELVLVDNGSTDGTPEYLDSLRSRPGPERVTIVRNEKNLGFAAGCNQGLAIARGEYQVLLNNDTVLTAGWLEGLIAWSLHEWPAVGMVGPMTSWASSQQQVAVDYRSPQELQDFAARRQREFDRQAVVVDRLIGFCLLMRREVWQKLGGLDERFGIGFFEDDDLCVRVRQAGFKLVMALNVFVHHYGNRTFKGLGLDAHAQLESNFAKFREKWGDEQCAGYRLPPRPDESALARSASEEETSLTLRAGVQDDEKTELGRSIDEDHASLTLRARVGSSDRELESSLARRPRVSLAMIVKNEEAHLGRCLASVADIVDEMIVVDTGSTDRTREVALAAGARVHDFTWVDSFAAARNESLRHASGEWIFWLDADEYLDEANRARLRELLARLPDGNTAYLMRQFSRLEPGTAAAAQVDQVRLFRNRPEIRWHYRVHEQILPAIRRAGGSVEPTGIVIEHVGFSDPATQDGKVDRNLRLLELEHAENPDDTFVLFNLGAVRLTHGQAEEALAILERGLSLMGPSDNIARKTHALVARACHQLSRPEEALAACGRGLKAFPGDGELLFWEAILLRDRKDLQSAAERLLRILGSRPPDHLTSVDAGLYSYRSRNFLAEIYFDQGRYAEAEAQWRAVVAQWPALTGAWEGLARIEKHRTAAADQPLVVNVAASASQSPPAKNGAWSYAPTPEPQAGSEIRVSVTMIVRNEEDNLAACLGPVMELVDEVVVVDTGSTDRTREIARQLGARVFEFPWIDHFAAARNEALRQARGRWILWLDADDRLDEANRDRLRQLLANLPDEHVGFVMKCRCLPDAAGVETEVDHLRLFRKLPGVSWTFRVHEQILPSIRASGGEVRGTDVVIYHTGYQDPALRERKLQRDLRLLQMEQAEQPDHPFTLFNLGSVYQELGKIGEALEMFKRSLHHSAPGDSIVRKLFALVAQCHRALGEKHEALAACRAGLELCADDVELIFQEGMSLRLLGQTAAAAACWERCLSVPVGSYFASINTGIRGHITRHNLAGALRELGRLDEAERHWQAALVERPDYEPSWRGLTDLYLTGQRLSDAETLAERVARMPCCELGAACLRARIALAQRDYARVRTLLEPLITQHPRQAEPRVLWSHSLLKEGQRGVVVEKALRDVIAVHPADPEARNNLEVVLREAGLHHGQLGELALADRYRRASLTPSDINEHLPTLYLLGRQCRHITEMGTRNGLSTAAWLFARPEKLVCYDRVKLPAVADLESLAGPTSLVFHEADVLVVDIEETDLLFIDTWHVYEQLKEELRLHAGKARRYVVLHDTETFGERGEAEGRRGLWPAVEEFLAAGIFRVKERFNNNNGLTVLERVNPLTEAGCGDGVSA